MVSCQKGPTRHAYAWQIGPFWQDTIEILSMHFGIREMGLVEALWFTSQCFQTESYT